MGRGKKKFSGFGELAVFAGETALPFPPVAVADSDARWHNNSPSPVVAEFDLEIWAAGSVALTDAELWGVVELQTEIASDDVDTVDFANNELDITTHGLVNGMGPIRFTTTGTLPTGIEALTDYWVIYVNAGTIQIAASLEDALEGTAVAFSDAGSGTHSLLGSVSGDFMTGSNNSYDIRWLSYGLLGDASDGAITLTAEKGYTTRIKHRPRTVAYGISATLGGAVATSASLYPAFDD